jgi:hypothetical protein
MTSPDIRAHMSATPGPLQWDCFSSGRIQRADHFSFVMSVDRLHADGTSAGVMAGYCDYSIGQHQRIAATPESQQVRTWIEFAESSDATSRCEFALVSCEM